MQQYELEVIPGLEEFAEREVQDRYGPSVKLSGRPFDGRVSIAYRGSPVSLNELRSVVAVHQVENFQVPRPSALLGHENLGRLLRLLKSTVARNPSGAFQSFRISAAGADSTVFRRLRGEVAAATRLDDADGPADLQVTCRRPPGGGAGWQVLVRLSPRPMSARQWRVCDLPGALNATVANVMVTLTRPTPDESFLNIACGSATLMVERLELGSPAKVIGVEISSEAIECAEANLRASGHGRNAHLVQADAGCIPLPSSSMDVVVADLPYGMLTGIDADIPKLYSAIVGEATRVARPLSSLVVITARNTALEHALSQVDDHWDLKGAFPIRMPFRSGYLRPKIYSLRRRSR